MSSILNQTLLRICALSIVMTAVAVLTLAGATQAHTELEQATPADGATLEQLPATGKLVFSEEVPARDVTVKGEGKALKVSQDDAHLRTVTYDLRSITSDEDVRLTWRLVSSHDGHESSGTIELHVRGTDRQEVAPATQQTAAPEEPRAIRALTVTSRIVGYLAMAVFVGGLLFVSLLWPAGANDRRSLLVLSIAVAAGVLGTVGSETAVLWRATGSTTFAQAMLEDVGRVSTALVVLWVLAAVVLVAVYQRGDEVVRQVPWRVGALVVAAGLVRTTGMTSHVAQSGEPMWMLATDFLHLAAISAWVGGLTMVLAGLLPRRHIDELEDVVPKFSKVAQASVLVIIGTGLILVVRIITSVDGFWATHYAQVLFLKLWLFALVLLAATRSKRWVDRALTKAVTSRRRSPVSSLATSVATETVLVATVLGAASVLVTSSPGV
jgi:putative copper export protein/methionine-rich copper-binding protein CopC